MKKLLIGLVLILIPTAAFAYNRCMDLPPLKPLPPLGCGKQVLMCVCYGDSCHYEWVCVNN